MKYQPIPTDREAGGAVEGGDDLGGGEDVDLPEDVYGAVIYSVVRDSVEFMTARDHDRLQLWINVIRIIFVVSSITFNYILQVSLLAWSYKSVVAPAVNHAQRIYREYHAECFRTDGMYDEDLCQEWPEDKHAELCGMVLSSFWFLYLMLSLWWLTMLNEFRKTDRIWRKILAMPTTRSYENQIVIDPSGKQRVMRIVPTVRTVLFVILVIPKHFLTVGLLITGTWWLVATASFCDLILNALALGFVIEIDELIFEATFPMFMSEELANFKLWRRRDAGAQEKQQVQWLAYRRSGIYWVVLLGGVYVYLAKAQGYLPYLSVLPGYGNDISPHCVRYWSQQDELMCGGIDVLRGIECFPFGKEA